MKKIIFPRKPHFCIDLHSTLTILMFLIYWRIMKPLLSLGTKLKLSQSGLFRIKKVPHSNWKFIFQKFNSRSWTETIHSGNRKIQNLLKCPIFNAKHHDMIEICISQLIAEILSILYFNKNFMTDLSSKIVQQLSMTQHIRNYLWIRLNP